MKVWNAFAKSRGLRIACFALAGALLVASAVGLGYPAAPGEVAPAARFEHRGQFDYTVYLRPSTLYGDVILAEEEEVEEVPLVFFRNIIREVQLAFSYKFDSSPPLANVTNQVVVSIVAENPGVWQKEITQLRQVHRGNEFRVEFPLSLSSLEEVVADIEQEIGISTIQRNFIVRAVVATTAETALGQTIEDTFSYEFTAITTPRKLELTGNLAGSQEGFKEGIRYGASGRFDYEVHLEPNELYETDVLRSEAPPAAQPSPPAQTLGPGLVYFPGMIDNIKASFSYQFLCDKPISAQSHELEITATIENPGMWNRTLVLVPRTQRAGRFAISFPVDIHYFTMVIDAIGRETGARGNAHNIVIEAGVRTVARTDVGTINDVYTQTLSGRLEANTLTFDEELSGSESGSIGGAATSGSPGGGGSRAPWIIGLVIALLALGYFGWSQTQLGLTAVSAGEAQALRAGKKYRQMMVDVEELPEVKATETVISLSSMDDLARIADDLVRPVLHQAQEGRHSYCVIDGGVRYLHVIKPQE